MRPNNLFRKLSLLNIGLMTICSLFIFSFIILLFGVRNLSDAVLGASFSFVLLILMGFTNMLWLYSFRNGGPLNFIRTKKSYYVVSYSFGVLAFGLVIFLYDYINGNSVKWTDVVSLVVISAFVNTLIVISHNYVALQDDKVRADIENSQLKAANTEAANQLLRQQIHPHFFFNALNILKSLYKFDVDAAEEYLVSLSNFLRMSLSSNNFRVIPLKDELTLCQDYLGMQKIRFGEALMCSFSVSEAVQENGYVPSFSIQPLLENAIKHNELTQASPLHISIGQEGDYIKVSNNVKSKITAEESTGIGLANLAERYRILSGDEIVIEDDGEIFSVSIKILSREFFLKETL